MTRFAILAEFRGTKGTGTRFLEWIDDNAAAFDATADIVEETIVRERAVRENAV